MNGDIVYRLVRVLVTQIVGQVLIDGEPQLLALNADVLRLHGALIAVDDHGVDPGGCLAGEPAVVSLGHGLAGPAFKGVGAVGSGPCPEIHGLPGQGHIGMHHKFLHIGGNLAPELGLIGNSRGLILRHGDPDLLAGLHNDTLGLSGLVRALIGVDDYILYKAGHIGVVPALRQRLHFLAGPGGEGIGAVVGPGPQIGRAPVLRHLNDHGNHGGFLLCRIRKSRHGQHAQQQHSGQQNCNDLFHGLPSCIFVGKPNIAPSFSVVNGESRKQFRCEIWSFHTYSYFVICAFHP